MKNNNTKGLREGAMMVALTVVLILATRYVPFFGLVGTFACGIPLAALAARNGFRVTIPAVVAVFGVAILIAGDFFAALSAILMSVLPGGVAGYMLGKKQSFFTALFATCVTICIGWMAELLIIELFVAGGIDEMIAQALNGSRAMLDSVMQTVAQSGVLTENASADEFAEILFNETEKIVRLYMPSFVVVLSMIEGYITIRLCGFVIKRAKLAKVDVVLFSQIKAPRSMCTVALISYVVFMFTGANTVLSSALANLVFILYTIIGVCGLSVADFKLKEHIRPTMLRFAIYVAVFIFGGALIIFILLGLVVVGILDSRRDFRKLGTAEE